MKNLILTMANLLVAAVIVMAIFGINPAHAANMLIPTYAPQFERVEPQTFQEMIVRNGGFIVAAIERCEGLKETPALLKLFKSALTTMSDERGWYLMHGGHDEFIHDVKILGLPDACKEALIPANGVPYATQEGK